MAIYSAVPTPEEQTPNTPSPGIDIDAWTISALQSLSVSPITLGTNVPLSIPIDEPVTKRTVTIPPTTPDDVPRRPPSARDSMKKRDSLLKGKEGSRQRRRWENDRLLHVPNVQPPLPSDWAPHPTHRISHIPYALASFWDRGVRQAVDGKTTRLAAQRKAQQLKNGSATGLAAGEVPRDLREASKKSHVIKSWVRALEEPVRQFLHSLEAGDEIGSDDEEIVFTGRGSRGGGWKMAHREVQEETVDQGIVFDSFGDVENAAYKFVTPFGVCTDRIMLC